MTGRIVFLNPNMKDELGSIDLMGLGFKSSRRGRGSELGEDQALQRRVVLRGHEFNLAYTDM